METQKLSIFKGFDLQRCIQRYENPLLALKTRVFHHRDGHTRHRAARYAVAYAAGKTIDPEKLACAGIGFMPIGKNGHCLEYYTRPKADKDWETTYGVDDWKPKSWRDAYGLQIYTGIPSGNLTSLDFEYEIIRDHPQPFLDTLSRLCELTENPLLVISKSGGLRFECRTPGYVHRKTEQRYVATWKNHSEHKELYLEIFGEKGLSRYDARYEIYTGSLLDIPVIDPHALFEIVDQLREQIGVPRPEKVPAKRKPTQTPEKREKAPHTAAPVKIVDGLPEGIAWRERKDGSFESVRGDYPCEVTKHRKSHGAAQYYKQPDGQIDAFCHNCQQPWIVKPSDRAARINEIRAGRLSPLAINRLPSKLAAMEQFSGVFDTLAKAREKIAEILKSSARVFGFRADTGVGKNHENASYVIDGGPLLQTPPTGELAAEQEVRMSERGIAVFRYRGLMYHWQDGEDVHLRFPHDAPCIQASRCEAYRQKGGNMYQVICPSCPVLSECLIAGYRSQANQAAMAAAVLMPIPDVFTNPTYRGFLKPYLAAYMGTERLCIVDEADVFKLFVECRLTKVRLKAIMAMWKDHTVAEFAEKVLTLCEIHEAPYKIAAVLSDYTETELQVIKRRLQQVKVDVVSSFGGTETRVMSLDDAVKDGYISAVTDADIAGLIEVGGNWGLIDQLQAFFNHYSRPEDAPMAYHGGVLRWVVPPVVDEKVWKLGFMSATLNGELLQRALPDAEMHDLPPVGWEDGAEVYQLRTHKAPRRTVYELEKSEVDGKEKWVPMGFSDTGRRLWHLAEQEIRSTPEKRHGIISYKQVLEWITPEISELGVEAVANFGGLVGLDTKFENVDTLWVLFAPEVPPSELEWNARMVFGNDTERLSFERGEDGHWIDGRVQQVFDACVIAELVQAVGRGRLVLYAKRVVVVSAHHLPGITERAVLFDETDWEVAGGLANLASVVADREAAELEVSDDVRAYAEATGVSKRWAYKQTEKARKKSKADTDAELLRLILERKAEGIGERKIATKLGISYGKVRSLLKNNKVH